MKKLLAMIKKIFGSSPSAEKAFTLVELLIVIAVLGVLATATLLAIDPVDRLNAANDSSVQRGISSIAVATESYAAAHDGAFAPNAPALVTSGDLKSVPAAPTNYTAFVYTALPGGCTTACTSVTITGQLKSKKYTSASTPFYRYESTSGKNCAVLTAATACP